MDTNEFSPMKPNGDDLFDRVISILEQARTNVVRSVNNNMVIAYWLIGREIVQEIQGGDNRAEYGKQIIKDLSDKLNSKYGKGFSTSNLWYFRQFYIVYSNREPKIRHKLCGELDFWEKLHKPCGVLDDLSLSVEKSDLIQWFSPPIELVTLSNPDARYSVLNDSKQLFASKYMLYLPTEEELRRELERERRLIEERQPLEDDSD